MEYYSAIRKKITPYIVLIKWMNLAPIIQSEVSQKEKDKYRILAHIYGIYKDGTAKPFCRVAMETKIENSLVHTVGKTN